MPRRGSVARRRIVPESVYGSVELHKFINCVMQRGKKSVSERLIYDALEIVGDRTKRDPLEIFHEALENVKPVVEIRPRRVGGQTYQVPIEVRPERRTALAYRWLIQSARKGRPEKSMAGRLAGEFLDAARNEGAAVRRKVETHRMAEANKAFAHYRW